MRLIIIVFLIIGDIYTVYGQVNPKGRFSDAYLTTPELLKKYGYPEETHLVTTKDGYILTIHRIPYGKGKNKTTGAPVLLQHGMFHTSADWILTGPNYGLGYLLADAGYDVWMANSRGNTYSTEHVSVNTTDDAFWDFSFHEMGIYDLPATLDYIIQITKQKKVFYISHSLGSTIFLIMASLKPSYNKKVRAVFGLAPSSYLAHAQASVLVPVATTIARFQDSLPIRSHILPHNDALRTVGVLFCRDGSLTKSACDYAFSVLGGFGYLDQVHSSLLFSLGHTPAGTSRKSLAHLGQLMISGRFCQYDYGLWRNFLKYGRRIPPDYSLSKITVPTYLMYGDNDLLVRRKDVERLYRNLVNVKKKVLKTVYTYSHFDFLMAANVKSYLYDYIINEMQHL